MELNWNFTRKTYLIRVELNWNFQLEFYKENLPYSCGVCEVELSLVLEQGMLRTHAAYKCMVLEDITQT